MVLLITALFDETLTNSTNFSCKISVQKWLVNEDTFCTVENLNITKDDEKINYVDSDDIKDTYFKKVIIKESSLFNFPIEIFKEYPRIFILEISSSEIMEIKENSFNNSKGLYICDLSHNKLTILKNQTFIGATHLNILNLNYNQISDIQIGAFSKLSSLSELKLSFNKLKSIDSNLFSDLLELNYLQLDNNQIEVIEPTTFLKNIELRDLKLNNNFVKALASDTIPSNLKSLNIGNNQLTELDDYGNVELLTVEKNQLNKLFVQENLRILKAGHNQINSMTFSESSKLFQLHLPNNSLSDIQNITELPVLQYLDISFNKMNLTNITFSSNLIYLNLSYTNLNTINESHFVKVKRRLNTLDLSFNNLTTFDLYTPFWFKLKKIFLKGNKLNEINFTKIKNSYPRLEKIYISSSSWNCKDLGKLMEEFGSIINSSEVIDSCIN